MGSIQILGTSHISKQSVKEIRAAILGGKPDFVAIELDKRRLYALMHEQKGRPGLSAIRSIGLQGYLFSIFGSWLQKKLGNIVGIKPGSDMLSAVQYAKEAGSEVLLMDRDIEITLKRFSRRFGAREKWNLFVDTVKGMFSRKHRVLFDLTKVPPDKVVENLMGLMEKRYPGIYDTIVRERNAYMAARLAEVMAKNPDASIIAVVGAGHKKGLYEDLHKIFKRQKEEMA